MVASASVSRVALVLVGLGSSSGAAGAAAFPVFRGTYGSNRTEHFRFGYEVGVAFAPSMQARVEAMGQQAASGAPAEWIARHVEAYPLYAEEIRGMAAGSGVALEALFALNLAEELSGVSAAQDEVADEADHCSDAAIPAAGLLAHNEDGSESDFGHMFVAEVEIDGSTFGAFTYAGELCSGAFAWTPALGFTLNYVRPATFDTDNGLGRAFVSRALLAAATPREAIAVAASTPMLSGHNYQLAFWDAQTLANVEAAAFANPGAVTPLQGQRFYFHANEYDALEIDQVVGDSTLRRTVRATKQWRPAPSTADDLLRLLNDTRDVDGSGAYPIYRTTTLATTLFDLKNRTVSIFDGPPANRNLAYHARVPPAAVARDRESPVVV